MVLKDMGVLVLVRGHEKGWSGGSCILITNMDSQRLLLAIYTIFMSLSNKESVIVRTVFPAHASREQGKFKVAPVLRGLLHSLDP